MGLHINKQGAVSKQCILVVSQWCALGGRVGIYRNDAKSIIKKSVILVTSPKIRKQVMGTKYEINRRLIKANKIVLNKDGQYLVL